MWTVGWPLSRTPHSKYIICQGLCSLKGAFKYILLLVRIAAYMLIWYKRRLFVCRHLHHIGEVKLTAKAYKESMEYLILIPKSWRFIIINLSLRLCACVITFFHITLVPPPKVSNIYICLLQKCYPMLSIGVILMRISTVI